MKDFSKQLVRVSIEVEEVLEEGISESSVGKVFNAVEKQFLKELRWKQKVVSKIHPHVRENRHLGLYGRSSRHRSKV